MGEYLSILSAVQRNVYANRLNEAKTDLKRLLNSLNIDYTTSKNAAEKEKVRAAITKLLPALDDLKRGAVTKTVIRALGLDEGRLYGAKAPTAPVEPAVTVPTVAPAAPAREFPLELPEEEQEAEEQATEAPERDETSVAPAAKAEPAETPAQKAEDKGAEKPKKPAKHGARRGLAPLLLDDYIGQEKAKKSLKISISAAKKENRALGHLLICSPYGLGKTTLANIIANEMDMPFFTVNATNLKDTKALTLFFTKIKESCIVFIDEIHSLKNDVQTVLLSILSDYAVSFIDDAGEEQSFELPPFTLIGATTQAGELLKPFLNRFTILELVDYTEEEKEIIVRSKFAKLGYEITPEAVADVARRSRGVPRTIETFAKGIRDIALTEDTKLVTKALSEKYFVMYDIDALGLNKNDLQILHILAEAKKPLALITLESKTGIQREDLAYRYEPYLLKLGFIDKTERGRILTQKGREYIFPGQAGVTDTPQEEGGADETPENGDGAVE